MRNKRWPQGLVGVLLGGGCLWYSLRGVDVGQAVGRLGEVSWPWVGVALVGVVLVSAGKALRWQWLYPRSAPPLSWTAHFFILLIAQMLNLVVPVRLGEVARLGLMQQEQRPAGMTLGTIAVEKSLDLVATGLLLLLVVPLAVLPAWLHPAAASSVLFTGGALLALLLLLGAARRLLLRLVGALPRPRREPWARWSRHLVGLVETMLEGLGGLGGGRLFAVLMLTSLVWLLSAGVMRAVLLAFGSGGGWAAALVLMLAIAFSNLAPTPPALIGLVGAVTEEALAPFGVLRTEALALGMVLNVVLVGPPVLLGGWAAGVRLLRLLAVPGRGGLRRAVGLAPLDPPAGE